LGNRKCDTGNGLEVEELEEVRGSGNPEPRLWARKKASRVIEDMWLEDSYRPYKET
jgi:hypothetical protein